MGRQSSLIPSPGTVQPEGTQLVLEWLQSPVYVPLSANPGWPEISQFRAQRLFFLGNVNS